MGDGIDGYTCIRKGKINQPLNILYSIFYYSFKHCKLFDIERISFLITSFNLQHIASETSNTPDHSIVLVRASIFPLIATNNINVNKTKSEINRI